MNMTRHCYVVTYDLHGCRRNYAELYKRLHTYPSYSHPAKSVWLIRSNDDVDVVRDDLLSRCSAGDTILVAEIAPGARWGAASVAPRELDWMHRNI